MNSRYEYLNSEMESNDYATVAYKVVACCIFALMAFVFLFPCNLLIPLDRRTVAVLGAALVYITRTFTFADSNIDLIHSVDFDVLILLASIMMINHLVVHLKETKQLIAKVQYQVQNNPLNGFWLVSGAAFCIAPFLTNDGVCLLFVELILDAFEAVKALTVSSGLQAPMSAEERAIMIKSTKMPLETGDAIFFLLTLACSSNIGSALTYTGNPQNMIIAQDANEVLPPIKFLGVMFLPALISWLITTWWIQRTWLLSKASIHHNGKIIENSGNSGLSQIDNDKSTELVSRIPEESKSPMMSPRRRLAIERQAMIEKIRYMVVSPFPYMILLLLVLMIVMIFVNIMPISALTCISAIIMIVSLVLGNHWRGKAIWSEVEKPEPLPISLKIKDYTVANQEEPISDPLFELEIGESLFKHSGRSSAPTSLTELDIPERKSKDLLPPMTSEEKLDNLNEFFEELFKSIDYSILIIFLGTFIVVANIDSTGIPKAIWESVVGDAPFKTIKSVVGVSLFVLIVSQLLGNVAVVYLAVPNVEVLEGSAKAYAWAVISFVATVGGNLTITGSAANIIVAEKVARLDPNSSLGFFRHFKVCFFVTLLCCILGSIIITAEFQLERIFFKVDVQITSMIRTLFFCE